MPIFNLGINLMNIRLSDLKNFVETAKASTMAAASRQLGITQPSLSESIKRLEEDLNTALFYRSRMGINLTPSGRELLDKAKAVLSKLDELHSFSKSSELLQTQTLIVGCHPVVGSYILPSALAQFGKLVDHYKIKLKHGSSREIQNMIQLGQVDVGFVINPQPVPDIVLKKIGEDSVYIWSHGKPNNKIICNPDIFQTQTILRKWKSAPKDMIESENLELIARLTEGGVGYSILPEKVVHLLGLKLKKHIDLPSYRDDIYIVHRPEFGKNSFEKLFLENVRSTLKS